MFDICFSDSACGSLKSAITGAGYGIRSNAVYLLPYSLDYGEIDCELYDEKRCDIFGYNKISDSDYVYDLSAEEFSNDEDEEEYFKEYTSGYVKKILKEISHRLDTGESVRIWYSHCPYSLCGFYWFCNFAKDWDNEIFIVKCPDFESFTNGKAEHYIGWGQLNPKDFFYYEKQKRMLYKPEKEMFSKEWEKLRKENSPIRTVINNVLVSVDSDFYDSFIIKQFKKKKCQHKQFAIGDLCALSFGVGAELFSVRIEALVKKGVLRVIEGEDDGEHLNWNKKLTLTDNN